MSQTKKVRVTLSGLIRVEYTEVVEVPIDTTAEALDQLVEDKYAEVDGGKYVNDGNYWEQGTCCYKVLAEDVAA